RVELRVRGVPTGQGAVEVARPDRVELVGHLVGPASALDDGERAAGLADHVGVGREVEPGVDGPGPVGLAQRVGYLARPDVPVAVPLRLAVADAQAVDHAAAD